MKEKYEIQEVFNLLGEDSLKLNKLPYGKDSKVDIEVDGFKVHKFSLRYMTFFQKGITCSCCGKMATHFTLDPDTNGATADFRRHFNLRADDGTLFTKDHIQPKSKGGLDEVSNMQTYCTNCNSEKGNTWEGISSREYITATNKNGDKKLFTSIKAAVNTLLPGMPSTKSLKTNEAVAKKIKEVRNNAIETTIKLMEALNSSNYYFGYIWAKEVVND